MLALGNLEFFASSPATAGSISLSGTCLRSCKTLIDIQNPPTPRRERASLA